MRQFSSHRVFGLLGLAALVIVASLAAVALWPTQARQERPDAPVQSAHQVTDRGTGLPVPRFVSLKNGRVNVRRGPSREYPIAFQFQRDALPVEIIREFENWRLIRDSEGEEGWVLHSLLSGVRTAMVAPWDRGESMRFLRSDPRSDASIAARIEPQVVVEIDACDGTWCSVEAGGHHGYLEQNELWGVYSGERIE